MMNVSCSYQSSMVYSLIKSINNNKIITWKELCDNIMNEILVYTNHQHIQLSGIKKININNPYEIF
jgi:hypothetical protein